MRIWFMLLSLIVWRVAVASPAAWYFEHRYSCAIGTTSITVSLKQTETHKKCFEYIERIAEKVSILEEDIQTAQWLIGAGRDIAYRNEVVLSLQKEHQQYLLSRQQIITAMDDFERELFIRVKWIVYVYLNPRYEELSQTVDKIDELLYRTKMQGTIDQYQFVIDKRDQLYRERLILDAIRAASSFETLIVPLRKYFQDYSAE